MDETATPAGWPNRYRPDDLDHMGLSADLRERFTRYLARGLPRSLILYGPPGFGKTTVARILVAKLYPDRLQHRWASCPETGGVDFVRHDLLNYIRGMSMLGGPKVLVLEEAEKLTEDAQKVLRVPMEEYDDLCKIILLTNDLSKMDAAVLSRCEPHEMTRPPLDECARVLADVLAVEEREVPASTIFAFTREHFSSGSGSDRRDMRTLLAAAQHDIETAGTLRVARLDSALTIWEGSAGVALWQRPGAAEEDGAKILNALHEQFSKYVDLPAGGAEALALWTLFAWAHEAFSVSPILALVSPTMRAGKSTVFEMLEQVLIPETCHPSHITPAVLFRMRGLADADQGTPPTTPRPPALCLLLDEADTWVSLGRELQAVLDSGHTRRGAFVARWMGGEVGRFSTWYPKALALIERPDSPLPEPLRDRSIVIPMQRKPRGVVLPKFPKHRALDELSALQERAAGWAREHFAALRELGGSSELLSPAELDDRAKDNWHVLLSAARIAGGEWEARARQAALILSDRTRDSELLIELLKDIKRVFDAEGLDRLPSVVLVERLKALDGTPWKELRLSTIRLSRRLRPQGIRPMQLWVGANKNGYEAAQFADAWNRHL